MTCVDKEWPGHGSAEHHHSRLEKKPSEEVEPACDAHADVIDWLDVAFKM
jgi:hypothetical protein